MNWQFYVLIFGSLAAVVALIVGGIYMHNGWGVLMIIAGVVGAVAWLVFAFQIMTDLNSDI